MLKGVHFFLCNCSYDYHGTTPTERHFVGKETLLKYVLVRHVHSLTKHQDSIHILEVSRLKCPRSPKKEILMKFHLYFFVNLHNDHLMATTNISVKHTQSLFNFNINRIVILSLVLCLQSLIPSDKNKQLWK